MLCGSLNVLRNNYLMSRHLKDLECAVRNSPRLRARVESQGHVRAYCSLRTPYQYTLLVALVALGAQRKQRTGIGSTV